MNKIDIRTHVPNLIVTEISSTPETNANGERQITVNIPASNNNNRVWTETTTINQNIVTLTNECLLIRQAKDQLLSPENSWARRFSNTLHRNNSGFSSFLRMLGRIFLSPLSSVQKIKQLDHLISQHEQQAAAQARHLATELVNLEQRLTPESQRSEQPPVREPIAPANGPSVFEETEELFEFDTQGPYADLFKEIQRRCTAPSIFVHTVPSFYVQG